MKKTFALAAAFALLAGTAGTAFAQPRHDDHHPGPAMHGPSMTMHGPSMAMHGPIHHSNWHKGTRLNRSDWNRGSRIDYRQHHLSAPPRGYEWRQVDGDYVLAVAATGLIASIIAANQ